MKYKITAPHPIDLGAPGDFVELEQADAADLVAEGHLTRATEPPPEPESPVTIVPPVKAVKATAPKEQ